MEKPELSDAAKHALAEAETRRKTAEAPKRRVNFSMQVFLLSSKGLQNKEVLVCLQARIQKCNYSS